METDTDNESGTEMEVKIATINRSEIYVETENSTESGIGAEVEIQNVNIHIIGSETERISIGIENGSGDGNVIGSEDGS